MPVSMVTSAEQVLWAERINKEAVNAIIPQGRRDGFSVRQAVRVPMVPGKFKPGHIDPSTMKGVEAFDPASVGWDPQGKMATDFRRSLNAEQAGPRQRHQFPETAYQDMGWSQAKVGPLEDRSVPAGSKPTLMGIGWHHGSVEGIDVGDRCRQMVDEQIAHENKPRQRFSRDGNVREELGVGPFSNISQKAKDLAKGMVAERRRPGASQDAQPVVIMDPRREGTSLPLRRHQHDASQNKAAAPSEAGARAPPSQSRGAAARSALLRASSVPSLPASDTKAASSSECPQMRHLRLAEEAMETEARYHQGFQNRMGPNKNYHPLSNSEVSSFADAYTKAWGRNIYHVKN